MLFNDTYFAGTNAVPELFAWQEAVVPMRGGWRCVLVESGGQCVMTPGMTQIQWLYANSLDTARSVS